MAIVTLRVSPVHCAICRAATARLAQEAGAHVVSLAVGGTDLTVDVPSAACLLEVAAAVSGTPPASLPRWPPDPGSTDG